MGLGQFDEKQPLFQMVYATDGDDTYEQILAHPATHGPFRIDRIYAYNTTASSITIELSMADDLPVSTNTKVIGRAVIPANAGNGTVAISELLALLLGTDNIGLVFQAHQWAVYRFPTALAGGSELWLTVQGGEL